VFCAHSGRYKINPLKPRHTFDCHDGEAAHCHTHVSGERPLRCMVSSHALARPRRTGEVFSTHNNAELFYSERNLPGSANFARQGVVVEDGIKASIEHSHLKRIQSDSWCCQVPIARAIDGCLTRAITRGVSSHGARYWKSKLLRTALQKSFVDFCK